MPKLILIKKLKLCEIVFHIFGDNAFLVLFINANVKQNVVIVVQLPLSIAAIAISITLISEIINNNWYKKYLAMTIIINKYIYWKMSCNLNSFFHHPLRSSIIMYKKKLFNKIRRSCYFNFRKSYPEFV